MAKRSGNADLPLHGGRVPPWLADRMTRLGAVTSRAIVQKAKLGREEELGALKRLDDQVRMLERAATGPSVEKVIADEFGASPDYGGRSVFGWEADSPDRRRKSP